MSVIALKAAKTNEGMRAVEYMPGLTLKAVRHDLILSALQHFRGRVGEAADALGISRKTIYYHLKREGLLGHAPNKF